MSGDPPDLELAVAARLADGHDVVELVDLLARQLSGILGDRVTVERAGLLRRGGRVRRLAVRLGADEYSARTGPTGVTWACARYSGGVRIRTDETTPGQWLAGLLGALGAEGQANQDARAALERIVTGGGP